MSTKALMTVEQLEQMETLAEMGTGQTGDYELLEGELISLPSATPGHARIRRLTNAL